MAKVDWEKSKLKISQALSEAMTEIKEWVQEASYLTESTSQVVKLEIEVNRIRHQMERTLTLLGREVLRATDAQGHVQTGPAIKKLIAEIRTLEKKLAKSEQKIKKTPVSWQAAKRARGLNRKGA